MDVRHHRVAWALGALALLVPLGVVLSRDGEDGASGPPGGTATTVASEATLPLLGTPGDGPDRDSGVRDSTGAPVPEAASIGEGATWLLTDGHLVRGRWHKADADAPTTYTGPGGSPIRLTPGPTWVEVLPDAGDIVAATAPINRTSNP